MIFFSLAAGVMVVVLIGAAVQRPRVSLFVAAILWAAYAAWEYYLATGVECDGYCNIRVDLVFMLPVLAIATYHARQSYLQPSKALMLRGMYLGVAGLAVLAFLLGAVGFNMWAAAAGICALALGLYALKLRSAGKSDVPPG